MTDLKTLCLATMATEWRPLAAQATRERQPPAEYLAQLVHLAVTGRRERRIQRRLQEARFPMLKTLDAFQFDAQPELDRDAILQVCSGAWCFRHQLLLPRPYLVLTKPLRLDIQCQRGASVKIGWKYLDD